MALVVLLLMCLAIGAGGTSLARRYALRHAVLDVPGDRSAHSVPTPRGGGLAIVVALLFAGAIVMRHDAAFAAIGWGALPGLALVAAIGLRDDIAPLSPWLRLGVHAIAAALLAWATWRASGQPWLALLAFGLAIALTNIWNFMDGIDGLAATQAILVAGAVALPAHDAWTGWALALVAATLGFLPFNVPKARIFLGDVGSGALGFAIAVLVVGRLLVGPDRQGTWHDAIAWTLPLSAFVIDAALTLGRRILRGERWWQAHAQHAYQAWARRLGAHMPVTLAYAGWTLLAIALMRVLARAPGGVVLSSCAAWYTAGAGIWWLLQGPRLQGKETTTQ